MPFSLLLAMQAAGMIVDWIGTSQQQSYADMGARLQQQGIEANVLQTRLETEDASLQSLKQLRQTVGSQIAIFAARGTSAGAGSAFSLLTESIGNQKSDERMRRLNQIGRENTLRGQGTIAKLNAQGESSKLWQGFAQRTINRFPTSPQAWGQFGKSFGLTSI